MKKTMKNLLLAAVLTLPLGAIPAAAQLTGPTLLNRVSIDLQNQSAYRINMQKDKLFLLDGTGAPVVSMEQNNRNTVTISGAVADLSGLPAANKSRAMARIALFNFSSPVGTLSLDEATGRVTMVHYLNSGLVSTATIAQVAQLCGDVVKQEAATLAQ